jgi:HEAT repeats
LIAHAILLVGLSVPLGAAQGQAGAKVEPSARPLGDAPTGAAFEADLAAALQRLRSRGARAASEVVEALVAGELIDSTTGARIPIDSRSEAQLIALLRVSSRSQVVENLLRASSGQALENVIVAMRLCGEIGGESAIEALCTLNARQPELERQCLRYTRALEQALARLLELEPRAVLDVRRALDRFDAPSRRLLASALGRRGDTESSELLGKMLGESVELDAAVLEGLGRCRRWGGRVRDGSCEAWVAPLLAANAAERRRCALLALGRLRAVERLPAVVELLEDEDARVRGAALWAAQSISGRRLGPDRSGWEDLLAREQQWLEQHYPEFEAALGGRDVSAAVAALREISLHSVCAPAVVAAVEECLAAPSTPIALAACHALATLGDPRSLEALVERLDDGREPVRMAAANALCAMTGLALPSEPTPWRELLDA